MIRQSSLYWIHSPEPVQVTSRLFSHPGEYTRLERVAGLLNNCCNLLPRKGSYLRARDVLLVQQRLFPNLSDCFFIWGLSDSLSSQLYQLNLKASLPLTVSWQELGIAWPHSSWRSRLFWIALECHSVDSRDVDASKKFYFYNVCCVAINQTKHNWTALTHFKARPELTLVMQVDVETHVVFIQQHFVPDNDGSFGREK